MLFESGRSPRKQRWSRRDMLSTGCRAAIAASVVEPSSLLWADQAAANVLIGVHLFGAAPAYIGSARLRPNSNEFVHPALHFLGELAPLQTVATARNQPEVAFGQRYAHLRFLQGGYVTAQWTGGQHHYSFREGFTLSASTALPGAAHDNPTLREALAGPAALPASVTGYGLGRQLDAAARLARASARLGLRHVSMLTTVSGFARAADDRRHAQMAELAECLAATQAFLAEAGLGKRTIVYTDSEVPQGLAELAGDAGQVVFNAPEGLFAKGFDAGLASWVGA